MFPLVTYFILFETTPVFPAASVQNPAAGQPDLLMAQTQPPLQPQIDPPFADPVPQMVAAAPPELTSQAEASRQQAQVNVACRSPNPLN